MSFFCKLFSLSVPRQSFQRSTQGSLHSNTTPETQSQVAKKYKIKILTECVFQVRKSLKDNGN